MKTLILILCSFCWFFSCTLTAQKINFRIDNDDMNHSYAIVNNTLLQVFGEDTLARWLSDDKRMLFRWETDSVGNVLSMEQLAKNRPQSRILSQNEIDSIILWMRQNDIRLPYCVDNNPPLSFERHEEILMEFFSNHRCFHYVVGFPGWPYSLERTLDSNSELTDIECLKNSIQRHIAPTMREMIVTQHIKPYHKTENDMSDPVGTVHYDNYFYDAYDNVSALYDGRGPAPKYLLYDLKKAELSREIDLMEFLDTVKVSDEFLLYCNQGKKPDSPEWIIRRNAFITNLMYDLAQSYVQKYHSYDFFTLACANRILEVCPDNDLGLSLMKKTLTNRQKSIHIESKINPT